MVSIVVAAVETTLGGVLDESPDTTRASRRGGHPDLAKHTGWKVRVTCQILPGLAAVDAAPQSAVRATAADLPEGAMGFPDSSVKNSRVGLVETEINRAGFIADVENLAPGCATVLALEHAALGVGSEGVTQRRDPHDIRVVRVDANLADVARFAQPNVAPASAGVGTAIDAVAVGDIDADRGFASAGIDDVRVRSRHGQGTDRGGGEEAIGDWLPVCSRIGRFPDATGYSTEIEGIGIMPCASYRNDPATPERSDAAPPEKSLEIELLSLGHSRIPSTSRLRPLTSDVARRVHSSVRASSGAS